MTDADLMHATGAARILPLRDDHLDDVLAIEAHTSPAGWTRATFRNELARPESRCYLVADLPAHGIVGFAGMQCIVDEAHVTTVAVAPRFRRRGLARRLVVALLRDARARGARAATLEVRLGSIAARRLYAQVGFRPVGIRPRYYDGNADALIMWAHDIDGDAFAQTLDELEMRSTDLPGTSGPHGDR